MNRALLSLSPEFFPLIKSMWMSPQLRSKTIPLTSSDLSCPSMRSLHFNWGVYSIHTATSIVKKRPWSLFHFTSGGGNSWCVVEEKKGGGFSFKRSVVTDRKTGFRLRKASHQLKGHIGECKWNQKPRHTTEHILTEETGPQPMKTWRGTQPYPSQTWTFALKNQKSDNRKWKGGKGWQMLAERATDMGNMVHREPKHAWYVHYASSNTGAESWRREGESRKRDRDGQSCLFLIKQVLWQEMVSEGSELPDPLEQLQQI